MALEAGVMTVIVEFAQGLKDMDWFGKQDPYCILTCGAQTFKTRTAKDGGKNPVWNETFRFNVINENDIAVTVKDQDVFKDDLIGTCRIPLARAREQGSERAQVPVTCKHNKQRGFISVSLSFAPNSGLRPHAQQQAAPGAYMPPGAPPGYPQQHQQPYPYQQQPYAPQQYAPQQSFNPYGGPPPMGAPYQPAPSFGPQQGYAPQPGGYAPPPQPHQHQVSREAPPAMGAGPVYPSSHYYPPVPQQQQQQQQQ